MRHQLNKSDTLLRRTSLTALLLFLFVTVLLPLPPASAAVTFDERMLQLVNGARSGAGVAPLAVSGTLAGVAGNAPYGGCGFPVAGRSTDMGARNYFSHIIADCGAQGAAEMLRAKGLSETPAENIAWVSAVTDPLVAAERLHNDLMADPAHRANILNPAFTHVGVGSWHTAAGTDWSGGGYPLRNVYVTTQIFIRQTAPPSASGGRYHPLTPNRILDTRSGNAALGAGGTMDMQVTGRGGVPSTAVSAVVLNVAVTGPTAFSYLTVFPTGESRPLAANLNYSPGQTLSNLVTAKVGAGGRLSLYNGAGSTHVIADIAGWYDDGTVATGARYHPMTPSRLLDTRIGSPPLPPSGTLSVQVTGQAGVPSTGVSAVVMNVTVTATTASGYLTVFPVGEPMPEASNLNWGAGQTVPNLVTAKLGTGGRVSLHNAVGTTHVIADVSGWFDDGTATTGGLFHPVSPRRLLDTRATAALGAAAPLDLQVAGLGGVPAAGASAVVMNVTVTGPTAVSFLTVFPAGEARPWTANLNFVPGQTVPNLVMAKLGAGGRVSMANAAGSTHVIADLAGWFDQG